MRGAEVESSSSASLLTERTQRPVGKPAGLVIYNWLAVAAHLPGREGGSFKFVGRILSICRRNPGNTMAMHRGSNRLATEPGRERLQRCTLAKAAAHTFK